MRVPFKTQQGSVKYTSAPDEAQLHRNTPMLHAKAQHTCAFDTRKTKMTRKLKKKTKEKNAFFFSFDIRKECVLIQEVFNV